MSYKITFYHYKNPGETVQIWTLENDLLTKEFTKGFLYVAIYVITLSKYIDRYYFVITGTEKHTIADFRSLEQVFGIPSQYNIINATDITVDLTKERSRPGRYTTWLRYHWYETNKTPEAVSINGSDLQHFRGMITAANAFDIDINELLLSKPYKDGVFYDFKSLTKF